MRAQSRREFLKRVGGAGGLLLVGGGTSQAHGAIRTRARIVILGGGAGGLTIAARLGRLLDGARITVVEPSEAHFYQPGFTLVAAGVYQTRDVTDRTAHYMPRGAEWLRTRVAAVDPERQVVHTADGESVTYDFLVVATGLVLDFEAVEGLSENDLGREGLTSIYAGPEVARAAYEGILRFGERGGVARFTKPDTPIKCAGAPIKAALIGDDLLRTADHRGATEFHYHADSEVLFSVQRFDDKVRQLYRERDVTVHEASVLEAIEVGRRRATFRRSDGDRVEVDYDYLHVTPPMRAHRWIGESGLAAEDPPYDRGGWLAVDQYTLQHLRYPNISGVGDVVGTPIGKTASTVRAHGSVVAENLVAVLEEREPERRFNGYTSCPLITRVGEAALVEFDYTLEETPTYFGFMDQGQPSWLWWRLKVQFIKPLYYNMLRGRFLLD